MELETTTATTSAPQETNPAPATETQAPASSETTQSSTQNTESHTSAPQKSETESIASVKDESGKSKYVLVKDEETGQRRLKLATDSTTAPAQTQPAESNKQTDTNPQLQQETITETAQTIAQELQTAPAPYSLDEFSNAIAAGMVDEARVPEEYKQQYAQYKINQAIEAKKQQEAIEQKKREALQKQLTPEEQAANMQSFLQNLDEEASKRAAHDSGLTEEELANIDFMDDSDQKMVNYKLLKEWHRQNLMMELQQRAAVENTARQKQAEIYQGINDFIEEAKRTEPNLNSILSAMDSRFLELPYAEGKKLEAVMTAFKNGNITEAQSMELRKYYDDVRKEFYAQKSGLSTTPRVATPPKPPVVERAGTGAEITREYVPDYKALRNSNPRDRRAWLADFLSHLGNKGR